MFRKPKKRAGASKLKNNRRQKDSDDDDEDEDTSELTLELQQHKKRKVMASTSSEADNKTDAKQPLMHQFQAGADGSAPTAKDLATSTTQMHPTEKVDRGNKLLAGPLRAPTNIRTTCRFDYQPDICKDYKDTGFCGFGDTCIYLHDRGDTLAGWQIDQQYEEEQARKKKQQQEQMDEFLNAASGKATKKEGDGVSTDDGIPFACYICRKHFNDPVTTNCGHYFCQACIMAHVKESTSNCPICGKDTHSVFNEPSKLIAKKRKLVGRSAGWDEYYDKFQSAGGGSKDDE